MLLSIIIVITLSMSLSVLWIAIPEIAVSLSLKSITTPIGLALTEQLKGNIAAAQKLDKQGILSFGGAYSNHIAAAAYAGKEYGVETIGVIRGEELASQINTNPTLQFAQKYNMTFYFISREDYRKKTSEDFQEGLKNRFGSFYYSLQLGLASK